jgi:hypothetical protein
MILSQHLGRLMLAINRLANIVKRFESSMSENNKHFAFLLLALSMTLTLVVQPGFGQ